MSTITTPLAFDRTLRPQLPPADDPAAASAIGSFAIARVAELSDELAHFASDRFDQAPRSASHTNDLRAALAHAVLDWLRRWPS